MEVPRNIQQLNQERQEIQKQIKAGSSGAQIVRQQQTRPVSSSNALDVQA